MLTFSRLFRAKLVHGSAAGFPARKRCEGASVGSISSPRAGIGIHGLGRLTFQQPAKRMSSIVRRRCSRRQSMAPRSWSGSKSKKSNWPSLKRQDGILIPVR
jgi:hypothetical protein